jgi:hypothetical protein
MESENIVAIGRPASVKLLRGISKLGMLSGWVFTASVNKGKRSSLTEHICIAVGFNLTTDRLEPNTNNAGSDRLRKITVEASYLD